MVTAFNGEESELATEHVNRLLETAGHLDLIRLSKLPLSPSPYHSPDRSPCNLVHNTALCRLTVRLNVDPYLSPEVSDWADTANELRGAFSTVRSYQLERITVHFRFALPSSVNEENFRQNCKQLDADSRGLHDVMARPYFRALREARIEIDVGHISRDDRTEEMDTFVGAMEPIVRRLFAPWHERGVVNVTSVTAKWS
ncbi:uncharacterized protein B0H18DRAFT_1119295 [Fomitopsis serialis]|uniref:uncharacterized protein n=1 Tax=Fomitopsis serialis TaxID=139415 RepID=UPI00200899CF|nr:uncharacterized protein B0H18DRAFT_1119295 [Neoantrodia serialis]KAH9925800.1 hypothetical protein B0H18DRAFT_1119295 [Neoantrodia serialis]